MPIVPLEARTRPVHPDDCALVHEVYLRTPKYFDIISIPVPTRAEVERELHIASEDPRRHVELVLGDEDVAPSDPPPPRDPLTGRFVLGYLDYTLNYPEEGDATVNLLLILEGLQSRGYGARCVLDLERRLEGKARRVLASIFGQNPRAERFWNSLGYSFAIDAKPLLDWYAKELKAEPAAA